MKTLKHWDDFHQQLYTPVKLLSPEGVVHFAEYHSSGAYGYDDKLHRIAAWTGFGEWLVVPFDGTWQAESCRADEFERRTGLPAQKTSSSSYGNPWYVPLKRNVEVRTLMKLAEAHHAYVGAYGRRMMEAACRVNVFNGGLWDIHTDDWVRTVTHAVEQEKQGRISIEDYILWRTTESAVHSWELHGLDFEGNWRSPINTDPMTAEEVMHLVALSRVWAIIADLRPAIEVEREVWWQEIEPWAEAYTPAEQQNLLEVAS